MMGTAVPEPIQPSARQAITRSRRLPCSSRPIKGATAVCRRRRPAAIASAGRTAGRWGSVSATSTKRSGAARASSATSLRLSPLRWIASTRAVALRAPAIFPSARAAASKTARSRDSRRAATHGTASVSWRAPTTRALRARCWGLFAARRSTTRSAVPDLLNAKTRRCTGMLSIGRRLVISSMASPTSTPDCSRSIDTVALLPAATAWSWRRSAPRLIPAVA